MTQPKHSPENTARFTLHRVTPTGGESYRILSPFHYEQVPGRIYSDEFKRDSFGRTEPRH